MQIEHNCWLNFNTSNNEEYETLIIDLQRALVLKAQHILVYGKSELIINQILDDYATREANLVKYLDMIYNLKQSFKKFHIIHMLCNATVMLNH